MGGEFVHHPYCIKHQKESGVIGMLKEKEIKHLYITSENEHHYSVRFVTSDRIGTFYSEDNEVIIHKENEPIKLYSLPAEGKAGASLLTALMNVLADSDVEIDMEDGIHKEALLEVLEQRRFEILEED